MLLCQKHGLEMSQLDLNLLKVLRVLLEVKNTRKAAEILHLSQPAVSRCLSRLRDYFDDELFIRGPHGLDPTSKALEIGTRLPIAMDMLMEAVSEADSFDPKSYFGKVTISLNGFIAQWLAPPLIKLIIKQAPNIELHIKNWEKNTAALIAEGQVQIGVNYFPLDISKQLVQSKLGTERFVFVCRKDHPLNCSEIKPEHFNLYAVASLLIPNWNEASYHTVELLKRFNITPKTHLRSSHLNIILDSVQETDLLFPCTDLISKSLDKSKFKTLNIDPAFYGINTLGDFALIVANKSRRHPLNEWLQQCILDCVDAKLNDPSS